MEIDFMVNKEFTHLSKRVLKWLKWETKPL